MRLSSALIVLIAWPAVSWAQSYTIATVAGGGTASSSRGDGGAATNASLPGPTGVAVDSAGNLYISDSFNAVRKVNTSGVISTVAGSYAPSGFSGDGGPATQALLYSPAGVAVDSAGNIYIADLGNNRIRKVAASGTITTVAGGGAGTGDGGSATGVMLSAPAGVAVDNAGNFYFSEGGVNGGRVRKVSANGTISSVAGNGTMSFSGDGGAATGAALNTPVGVAVDASGNIFIADGGNERIRKVSANGTISTVAGNGSLAYSGDGGPATAASIGVPAGIAVDAAGNLYITDGANQRIRMVSGNGTISTIAGNGMLAISGDGGPALSAAIDAPFGIAVGSGGMVYFTEGGAGSVRSLTPSGGSAPSVKTGGVVSAGAFGSFTSVAPGSWIEIYGSNLAATSDTWSAYFNGVNAPTSLDGVKVSIGGQAAFIDFVSPSQVNAQVPSNVPAGTQALVVSTNSGSSAPASIAVNALQPGILAPPSFIVGGKQYAAALFSDGATYALPPGAIPGVASRRAQPGDTITFYGVGFGPVTPPIPAGQIVQQTNMLASAFHLSIGGTEAVIPYGGLVVNSIGLYQINAVVPSLASSDTVPITFTLGAAAGTQTLYIGGSELVTYTST